jgi:hypothetical protein
VVRPALLVSLALLLGCVPPPTPEELAARHVASCREAGLAPDTDAGRLCLLLEAQNDRLMALERRLQLLESFALGPRPLSRGCCY